VSKFPHQSRSVGLSNCLDWHSWKENYVSVKVSRPTLWQLLTFGQKAELSGWYFGVYTARRLAVFGKSHVCWFPWLYHPSLSSKTWQFPCQSENYCTHTTQLRLVAGYLHKPLSSLMGVWWQKLKKVPPTLVNKHHSKMQASFPHTSLHHNSYC